MSNTGQQGRGGDATRRFYDRISHVYDQIADSSEHVCRERGQQVLAVAAGESVLEVGFGPGRALVDFGRSVGPQGSVHGLEYSPGMVDVARQRIATAQLGDRINLTLGDARKQPFSGAAFDAAFMSFTLELFPLDEIPGVLAELRRVLRPGGRLGVVSMAVTEHDSLLEKLYKWMHHHFPHFVDCQPIEAERYLREAGFGITHSEVREIWTLPVAILVGEIDR